MSEELKPEPMIDKQGVPWCSEEACKHFLDIGDAPIYECTAGKFCFEIPADPETLLCLPKVQAVADELERLRLSEELAWGLIANAHIGDWKSASSDWRHAAERWREEYHKHMPSVQPPKEG